MTTEEPAATKPAAQEAHAPKPAPQEAPAKQPAAKKSPPKKVAAKRRAAKNSAAKPVQAKRVTKKTAPKKRGPKKPQPKPVAAKQVVAKKAAAKKPGPKKRKGKKRPSPTVTNKAQAIRDVAKKLGKKVRGKDVIAALAAKHITVSSAQVSTTLKAAGFRRVRRKKRSKAILPTKAISVTSQTYSISGLVETKKLADKLGGTDRLKAALTALERLL